MKKLAIIALTLMQIVFALILVGVFVLIFMGKLYALVGCMAIGLLVCIIMFEDTKDEIREGM